MTKVTILGDESKGKKKLKPIELVKCLQTLYASFSDITYRNPSYYEEVVLLSPFKYDGYDLMLCIPKEKNNEGQVWLGHFNDGIVE